MMTRQRQQGFSIIELMIAVTISVLLLGGMMAMLVSSNKSFQAMSKAGRMLDNGSYAIQVLKDDIALAGFYGEYYDASGSPSTLPDPCVDANYTGGTPATAIDNALYVPIQGYDNYAATSDFTGTEPCIVKENISPNSDILVIRRVSTTELTSSSMPYTVPASKGGGFYFQGTSTQHSVHQVSSGDVIAASGDSNFQYTEKDKVTTQPIQAMMVDIYYISPCDTTTGSDCNTGGDGIPTLKRLYLGDDGTWQSEPIAEGIEDMQFTYGIDSDDDGIPNFYTGHPQVSDWTNVVTVGIHLLARNVDKTTGYTDAQTYYLGYSDSSQTQQNTVSYSSGDTAAHYKHKVFSATAILTNIQMRR